MAATRHRLVQPCYVGQSREHTIISPSPAAQWPCSHSALKFYHTEHRARSKHSKMSKSSTNASNTLLLRRQLAELTKHPVEGFSAGGQGSLWVTLAGLIKPFSHLGLVDDNNMFEWEIMIIGCVTKQSDSVERSANRPQASRYSLVCRTYDPAECWVAHQDTAKAASSEHVSHSLLNTPSCLPR